MRRGGRTSAFAFAPYRSSLSIFVGSKPLGRPEGRGRRLCGSSASCLLRSAMKQARICASRVALAILFVVACTTQPVLSCTGFLGQWRTTQGVIALSADGKGHQTNGPMWIAGTVSGNVLTGVWSQPNASGGLTLTLAADGQSFSGRWTQTTGQVGGVWNGVCDTSSTGPPDAAGSGSSAGQNRYLQSYGRPDAFVLAYSFDEMDRRTDSVRRLASPRRTEMWFYTKSGIRVMFDDKFFVKETRFVAPRTTLFAPTALAPADFTATTTEQVIETRYGRPDRVEASVSGTHAVRIFRYLKAAQGVKSFTFVDGKLAGVAAGFALTGKRG
jgi:hypothetical protein